MRKKIIRWSRLSICRRVIVLFLILVVSYGVLFPLGGCASREESENSSLQRFERTWIDFFDTVSTMIIYASDSNEAEQYFSLAEDRLIYYHQLYDIYNNYPDVVNLKTINDSAGGEPIEVPEAIITLMEQSLSINEISQGADNMALGPVIKLWQQASIQPAASRQPPSLQALQAAAVHCDIKNVIVDSENQTVQLKDSQGSLDVGSGAKGLAAELIIQQLAASGLQSCMLSLGGNVRTLGFKDGGELWRIGIQNPVATLTTSETTASLEGDGETELAGDEVDPLLFTVGVTDRAVVTSGVYQRFFIVDGERYHHIIDPATLAPSTYYDAITVISPDSGLADSLTTALFNMSISEGM